MRTGGAYPFRHVSLVPDLGIWEPGEPRGKKAKDDEIAAWCDANDYVIVTCDTDFRSAEMREKLLSQTTVEVIWFKKLPEGVLEQTEQIVKHYRKWLDALGVKKPAYRQWMQPPNGNPKKMQR